VCFDDEIATKLKIFVDFAVFSRQNIQKHTFLITTDRIYFLVLVQPKGDRLEAALSCSDTEGKSKNHPPCCDL